MGNSDPLYQRAAGCERLYQSEASSPSGSAGYWAGWLAGDNGAADPIALSQAWPDAGGTLLFLPQAPTDKLAFERDLIEFLAGFAVGFRPRFLWLRNPADAYAVWRYDVLSVLGTGASVTTSKSQTFKFEDYGYLVAAGTTVALDTTAAIGQFLFGTGTQFYSPQSRALANAVRLPMAGAGIGAWAGRLLLTGATAADTLQALGVMLRFSRLATNGDTVESVDLPVLTQTAGGVDLDMSLDPLAPLDPVRTCFVFAASALGDAPAALSSAWITTLGRAVELAPQISPPAGVPRAKLVFGRTPKRLSDAHTGSKYHLAPSGGFALTTKSTIEQRKRLAITAQGDQEQLMLGLAGTEYLGLAANTATLAVFIDGRPALVRTTDDPTRGPLDDAAVTSYASFVQAELNTGVSYFAQPQNAPLYSSGASATVLDFHPVLAGNLAPLSAAADLGVDALTALPIGAYIGLDPRITERARAIENAGLAPARRRNMGVMPQAELTGDPPVRAVTPPGLVAEVDGTRYTRVIIGNLPTSQTPEVAFDSIPAAFQAAMQSNQLFFVVANPAALGSQGALSLEISGWRFKLDPDHWRTDPNTRTYLLFKFAGRTLEELAADPASWGWQDAGKVAGGSLQDTSAALAAIFAAAKAAPPASPYQRFYEQIVSSAAWSGVLFLNAAIEVGELDPQLGFITAGVALDQFYAHHVGFSLTSYTLDSMSKAITLGQTAAFGLVDYQDPRDLTTTKTIPFGYKTLALTAQFANAALVGFAAQVELLTNRLFGTELTKLQPERGNNLLLSGSFHTVDGAPAYAFELIGQNIFAAASGALTRIEVASVGLQTESVDNVTGLVVTRFTLSGNLQLTEDPNFDLFSYGPASDGSGNGHLRYGNLAVRMRSHRDGSGDPSFIAAEDAMSFDLANSEARAQSLVAKFPLTLTSFIAVAPSESAPSPDKLGYVSIAAPIDQAVLVAPWYGFSFTLQLGTLGSLAGSVGLTVQLLTAWSPDSDEAQGGVYLGLKLPGLSDLGMQLPLQGVLSLGFRSFEMQRYAVEAGVYGYLLRLHRFALSFLGFSVPPGNTDVVLFGDPDKGGKGPLGWYAAYAKDLPPKKKPALRAAEALRGVPRSDIARLRRRRGGSHTP